MKKIKSIIVIFKENWLEYGLYLFVFLLPWQTRWIARDFFISDNVFEYGRISLYSFDIILVVLLIGYLFLGKKDGVRVNRNILILGISFVVYALASMLWANDKLLALYWGVRMMVGFGLFYLLQKINWSKVRLVIMGVIAGGIQGLLGIWQFLEQGVRGVKWLGMAEQKAHDLGTSVVEFGLERWLRAYGALPHPNILGALMVLSFIGVVYLVTKIQDKYHKLFLIFSASFIWLSILFSFSRAAWILSAFVFIFGIIYILRQGDDYVKRFGRGLWIYGFILLAVFTIATWSIVKTRLNIGPETRLEAKSDIERAHGYDEAQGMIKENWLAGTGLGNYTLELQNKYPELKAWDIQAVHNVYVLILAELGILGVVLLALLAGYILRLLIKKDKWGYVGMLAVAGSLFMFDHFWWTLGSGLYVVWLLLGISARVEE